MSVSFFWYGEAHLNSRVGLAGDSHLLWYWSNLDNAYSMGGRVTSKIFYFGGRAAVVLECLDNKIFFCVSMIRFYLVYLLWVFGFYDAGHLRCPPSA